MPDRVLENPAVVGEKREVIEQNITRKAVEGVQTIKPVGSTLPNVVLGEGGGSKLEATGEANVMEGPGAGESLTTGSFNTLIGQNAGHTTSTGGSNVCVGSGAGKETSTGKQNVFVGGNAGGENNGEKNIFIGEEAGEKTSGSSKLLIANNASTPIIAGVMSETAGSQELGFYGTTPKAKPEVTGGTVTAKALAEALATIGLVKVN